MATAPRPGTGRTNAGVVALAWGTTHAIIGGVALATVDDPYFGFPGLRRAGIVSLTIGGAALVTGVPLVISGAMAQRKYRAWVEATHLDPPRSGNGFLAAGTVALVAGSINLVQGAVAQPPNPFYLSFGGIQLATGLALVSVGAMYRSRYTSWLRRTGMVVVPGLVPLRGGGALGVSGRF